MPLVGEGPGRSTDGDVIYIFNAIDENLLSRISRFNGTGDSGDCDRDPCRQAIPYRRYTRRP